MGVYVHALGKVLGLLDEDLSADGSARARTPRS